MVKSVEELKKKLANRRWRLNNLYYIKDKDGKHIQFKLNWMQEKMFDDMWYRNIILKVRQLGCTTFWCIFNLDSALFDGVDAGIVAHRLDDASRIFEDKIKYAWEYLPEALKNEYQVDSSSAKQLKFTRGDVKSSIYVSTSLRSATVQRLHITELSYLDKFYPERAKEIKSGALNTTSKEQIISVEGTYEDAGIFSDMCEEAIEIQDRKLAPMEYRFFFFSWYDHPEYQTDADIKIDKRISEYLNNLEDIIGQELTEEQRMWYFLKRKEQKAEMLSQYPSTPDEALHAPIEGAYYTKQIQRAEEEGRITNVPWEKLTPCHTFWDLGNRTNMKIIIVQRVGHEIHIIDAITDCGDGVAPYAKELQRKPYIYKRHWMPHDAEPKEIGSGMSIKEQAQQAGMTPISVVPRIDVNDGILAVQNIFERIFIDKTNCDHKEKEKSLLKSIRHYRREWDKKREKWKRKPFHNWASHFADCVRALGVTQKLTQETMKPTFRRRKKKKRGRLGY